MEHPHHDDSHLPDAIENSVSNIEKLVETMINKMNSEDWKGYAWDALEKEFSEDVYAFQEEWNTHMEDL